MNLVALVIGLFVISYTDGFNNMYDKVVGVLSSEEKIDSRQTIFESSNAKNINKVFLGDSITQMGNFEEYFLEQSVLNRGKHGDTSLDLLNRIDEVVERAPEKIYLMIGTNDLWNGEEKKNYENNVRKLLNIIMVKSPNTKIIIQSITPVNDSDFNVPFNNNQVNEFNLVLQKLSREFNLIYVNLHPALVNINGVLKKEYTYDGIHLLGEGYKAWIEAINF